MEDVEWRLEFGHTCRSTGCADAACPLCALCQRRRCTSHFAPKYLAPCDDINKAICGAPIWLALVDARTGAAAPPSAVPPGAQLRLWLVDSRKMGLVGPSSSGASVSGAASGGSSAAAGGPVGDAGSSEQPAPAPGGPTLPLEEACALLENKSGSALLTTSGGGVRYAMDRSVLLQLPCAGQGEGCLAALPALRVTDSSEALLPGRAPPLRLAASLVLSGTGEQAAPVPVPVPAVGRAISEPFVVATSRVRSASKVEIPHLDDSVSRIEGVGLQTQRKLADIAAAAVAAGLDPRTLQVPENNVLRVGQLRDLLEAADLRPPLEDALKVVLRLSSGWDTARRHVQRAVHTDTTLRAMDLAPRTAEAAGRGGDGGGEGEGSWALVYKCGPFNAINPERPVGLLRRRSAPEQLGGGLEVDVVWLPLGSAEMSPQLAQMLPLAARAWWADGHPGWHMLPLSNANLPGYSKTGQPLTPSACFSFDGWPGSKAVQRQQAQQQQPARASAVSVGPPPPPLPPPPPPPPLSKIGKALLATQRPGGGALPSGHCAQAQAALASGSAPAPRQPAEPPASQLAPALPPALGGAPGGYTQSPFEDPAFQAMLMAMAAAQLPPPQQQGQQPAPALGDADSGSYSHSGVCRGPSLGAKRKAEYSLESWMALHASLDHDIELPQGLLQIPSLRLWPEGLAALPSQLPQGAPLHLFSLQPGSLHAPSFTLEEAALAQVVLQGLSAQAAPTPLDRPLMQQQQQPQTQQQQQPQTRQQQQQQRPMFGAAASLGLLPGSLLPGSLLPAPPQLQLQQPRLPAPGPQQPDLGLVGTPEMRSLVMAALTQGLSEVDEFLFAQGLAPAGASPGLEGAANAWPPAPDGAQQQQQGLGWPSQAPVARQRVSSPP